MEQQNDNRRQYKPTGPRQYRSNPSRGYGQGGSGRRKDSSGEGVLERLAPYSQEVMLIAAAVLAFVSIIVGVASCAASGPAQPAEDQAAVHEQASAPGARVDEAEKTTDSDGIVHGTTADGVSFTIRGAGESAHQEDKVTFAAVGDQIATDYSLELADAYAGELGDGEYDFKPFYKEVKSFIQDSDLRYINQETPLIGGEDGWMVSGYPTFVSPASCAEAISDTGFNLVNFTTNHSYDAGEEGIEFSQKVWARYPQIVVGGSFASQEDRETVQLIERNGIRFAFLAYSYGDNTYEDPKDEPNSYYAVAFDEESATQDIERAKQVADCVIVSMHWGEEYTSELTSDQKKQAQWLADQGVDLVVGTHAHNIQPVEYCTSITGKSVPVVFGLGDFVSGWTLTDTILSGVFTCDFVKQDDGRIAVENAAWHPTIEWSSGNDQVYVRLLENLSVDQINANTRTEDYPGASFAHIYAMTNEIIDKIPVSWGADADEKAKAAESGSADENAGTSAEPEGIEGDEISIVYDDDDAAYEGGYSEDYYEDDYDATYDEGGYDEEYY